ncbi:Aste57867_18719 [Aphanomyces stellatus]|uniref:Aste57867_18719 protein n=1 Tax=Aphanomyces stellatus TaxID=120398 RepID=A0A485LCQ4_9STRA|nr:hypothetical protein As57867_018655 [Aphanomyces stellatus]VFT95453.1 Aste57867_18719 [Aphanomyces stellatus]
MTGSFRCTRACHQFNTHNTIHSEPPTLLRNMRAHSPMSSSSSSLSPPPHVDRRRSRAKVNQRRYRIKQKVANLQLEQDVHVLRQDVRRLEAFLTNAPATTTTSFDSVQAIQEYFVLFGHGYNRAVPQIQRRQDACLRSLMAPDVECMGEVGIDALVNQWDQYGQLFDSLQVEVHHVGLLQHVDAVVVEVTMDMHMVVTATTLRTLFPHLLRHGTLHTKMLGQPMTLPVQCTFDFERTQVTRVTVDANVAMALVDLMGNAQDAAVALDGAQSWPATRYHDTPMMGYCL